MTNCKRKGSCANCQLWMATEERVGMCLSLYELTTFDECCGDYKEDPVKVDAV